MSTPQPNGPSSPRRPRPSRLRWRLAAVAAAVAGALALGACSSGPHGGGRGGHGAFATDPERAARFTERMADRIVSAVDGTPEQRARIAEIARAATTDLMPMRERMRDARRQSIALLSAPAIDRAAIETLRAQQLAAADEATRRIARAMADTAEVLTPEQRLRLAERMQRRGRWS